MRGDCQILLSFPVLGVGFLGQHLEVLKHSPSLLPGASVELEVGLLQRWSLLSLIDEILSADCMLLHLLVVCEFFWVSFVLYSVLQLDYSAALADLD